MPLAFHHICHTYHASISATVVGNRILQQLASHIRSAQTKFLAHSCVGIFRFCHSHILNFEFYSWRTWCNEGWRRNEEIKNKILQLRLRVRSMFNCNVLQYLSALTSSLEHLCTINVLHFNFERHIFPWKRILKQSREKCISVSDAIIF